MPITGGSGALQHTTHIIIVFRRVLGRSAARHVIRRNGFLYRSGARHMFIDLSTT